MTYNFMKKLNAIYKSLTMLCIILFLPLQNVQSTQVNNVKTSREVEEIIENLEIKLIEYENEFDIALSLCKDLIKNLYFSGGTDSANLQLILAASKASNFELKYSYIQSIARSDEKLVSDIISIADKTEAIRQEISIQKEQLSIIKLSEEEEQISSIETSSSLQSNKIGWDFPLSFNFAPQDAPEEHSPNVENLAQPSFMLPCPDYAYVSDLWNSEEKHFGFDLAANYGTEILASKDGVVSAINSTDPWGGGWGYFIFIEHDEVYSTRYAHCSSLIVNEGQSVKAGEVIGYVGSTGNSSGNHLHFEIYENGERVDPLPFLEGMEIS